MNRVFLTPISTSIRWTSRPILMIACAAAVFGSLATTILADPSDRATPKPAPPTTANPKSTSPPESTSPNGVPSEEPTADLIFLGAEHPIFVRLFAYIDGREIRAARADRVAKTLAELDDNRDGEISELERTAHPRALRSLGIPEKWTNLLPAVDRNPPDSKINAGEITRFLGERFGATVTLAGRVRRGNQAVELFDLIDADHDQRLTNSEFKAMPTRLHKLDADGDDAFSVIEVEPFRNPFGAAVAANTATAAEEIPWIVVAAAAERLLARFDLHPKDQTLSAKELGQPESLVAPADADQSGGLSLSELNQWLPSVPPHFALVTNAFKRKAGRTELSWIDLSEHDGSPAKSRRETAKNLEVKLADQAFQLQMTTTSRGLERDSVSFYRNQFRRSDADKNKYLDRTEFASIGSLGATFEMLDADDNGQIHEPELIDYLSLETASEQSRVILSFDRNEQSLFSLLDRNNDRRLTPRECNSTFERWAAFDHDTDQILNRSELSGRMRMTVELPKPRLFQQIGVPAAQMSGEPVIRSQNEGPVWFQGMDRNKDGDISRREFLGTDTQFRKWDSDGDGLISKMEASAS